MTKMQGVIHTDTETASGSLLDLLGEDEVGLILEFTDFQTAVQTTLAVSRSVRQRLLEETRFRHVWQKTFQRQLFSVEQVPLTANIRECIQHTRDRRQLLQNLLQSKPKQSKNATRHCFNLPNRFFSFLPITPSAEETFDWEDPPPVNFDCDSFMLTGTACSAEMLILDPFSGKLSVHANIKEKADQGVMEHAMLQATSLVDSHNAFNFNVGAAISTPFQHLEAIHANHHRDYHTAAQQLLIDVPDYFEIDLKDYFALPNTSSMLLHETEEVEVSYIGTETKPVLANTGKVRGTMVAVGRVLANDAFAENAAREQRCVELLAWFRTAAEGTAGAAAPYGDKHVCRFTAGFHTVDLCASRRRAYVVHRPLDASATTRHLGDCTVTAYPLLPVTAEKKKKKMQQGPRYFPDAILSIPCREPISTFAVSATGQHVVVGTASCQFQVWEVTEGCSSTATIVAAAAAAPVARCLETVAVKESLLAAMRLQGRSAHVQPSQAPIFNIAVPRHLSIDVCGFLTVQYDRNDGTTVVLWRMDAEKKYQAQAMINLPLSALRLPEIHFDGRRLIVFGQDHIGMILLVYHIFSTNEDVAAFKGAANDSSGGVTNFTDLPVVRFANRIRHAALGGLEYHDLIHMSCNERFIVINTKTGNLMTGRSSPHGEGLLVIDLEDHA